MEQKDHKKLAIDAFNKTWDLIDLKERTTEQVLDLIHMAHTSRHHWKEAGGTPLNLARGEWQISHMYAVIGHGESALFHAEAYKEMVEENNIKDFDLVFVYEALAYAHKVLGNEDLKNQYLEEGYKLLDQIEKKGDRDYSKSQLDLLK